MNSYYNFNLKLHKFIDEYYKNRVKKGLILFFVLVLCIVLLVSFLEFISWFSPAVRIFIFYTSLVSILFIFYYFLLIPGFRYFGVFKRLTNLDAANIVRREIPNLKDNLNNILELNELKGKNIDFSLVNAALEQKISLSNKYEFNDIIDNKNITPLFKYIISLIILYTIIIAFYPNVFVEGSSRIIHYNKQYTKNIGYHFYVNESKLSVEKGKDFDLKVAIIGEEFPSNISVFFGSNEYLMTKIDTRNYTFKIKNVNNELSFRVGNGKYKSDLYIIKIINAPLSKSFLIDVKYPDYMNRKNELFNNISNLKVAKGSVLNWKFVCINTDTLSLIIDDSIYYFNNNTNSFIKEIVISNTFNYKIVGKNRDITSDLISESRITALPDLFPEIYIEQIIDDNNQNTSHFIGEINDDFGFSALYFTINNKNINIPFNKKLNNQKFYITYTFDEKDINEYVYYFEVFDNDRVSGFKSTKSKEFIFKIPDYTELAKYNDQKKKEILEQMEKTILLAEEFKKDINYLKKKLFNENLSSYEKKQLLEGLKNKQNDLEDILKNLSKQNFEKNRHLDSFSEQSEELKKKQNEIQELLKTVMDDELKDMLDELEKLMNDSNKDINKDLDKLEYNYDNLSEQLDKNLELLKKYEVERSLENIVEALDKISEDQDELQKNDFLKADSIIDKNLEQTKNLQNDFNKTSNDNDNLKNPMNLENLDNDFDDLKESLENSKNDDNKTKKEDIKKNSEQAKKLSEKINTMLNNNRSNESGENEDVLRQILENLIYFSFSQESINQDFSKISRNSPNFLDIIKDQNNIASNFKIIKDSLNALSKRTTYLGNHISKKVFSIESGLFDIDDFLNSNLVGKAKVEQRLVLEYTNDLILLLSESLKNMENSSGSGSGSSKKKKKPKQSKPSMSEMRKSQESMKSQIQNMIDQMKGEKGNKGKPNSEQLGKMLAEQEMFQQLLNDLQNNSGSGKEFTKQIDEIKKLLDKNKRDIVRNQIDQSTLNRQKEILTKMLEAEKSDKEREIDEQRKSNEAFKYLTREPNDILEKYNSENNFNDILNKSTLKLNYFYKNKYLKYIKELN